MEIKRTKLDNGAYQVTITSSEKVLIKQTVEDSICVVLDDTFHVTMKNLEDIKHILSLNYNDKNYFDLINDINSGNSISFQVDNKLGLIALDELEKIITALVTQMEKCKESIDTLALNYTD